MKKEQIYQLALYVLGFIVIIDGLGSILVYLSQPWFPDHTVRIIRMIVGACIIFIGKKMG